MVLVVQTVHIISFHTKQAEIHHSLATFQRRWCLVTLSLGTQGVRILSEVIQYIKI